jgi:hypothetical protein
MKLFPREQLGDWRQPNVTKVTQAAIHAGATPDATVDGYADRLISIENIGGTSRAGLVRGLAATAARASCLTCRRFLVRLLSTRPTLQNHPYATTKKSKLVRGSMSVGSASPALSWANWMAAVAPVPSLS